MTYIEELKHITGRHSGAAPHVERVTAPAQFIRIPKFPLSMWGNDMFGDCVTAEECFAKACDGIDLGYHKAVIWARNHWSLNGAGLWEVMTLMQTDGIYNGDFLYIDGPFKYVDFTDAPHPEERHLPGAGEDWGRGRPD